MRTKLTPTPPPTLLYLAIMNFHLILLPLKIRPIVTFLTVALLLQIKLRYTGFVLMSAWGSLFTTLPGFNCPLCCAARENLNSSDKNSNIVMSNLFLLNEICGTNILLPLPLCVFVKDEKIREHNLLFFHLFTFINYSNLVSWPMLLTRLLGRYL